MTLQDMSAEERGRGCSDGPRAHLPAANQPGLATQLHARADGEAVWRNRTSLLSSSKGSLPLWEVGASFPDAPWGTPGPDPPADQFTLASWPPPWLALRFHRERQSVCETEKPEASQRVRQISFWLLPWVRSGPRPSYTCQGPGVTRVSGWEAVQACSEPSASAPSIWPPRRPGSLDH